MSSNSNAPSDPAWSMGDNKNKNNSRKAEAAVTRRFMNVIQQRLNLLREQNNNDDDKFQLSPAERKTLLEINNFGLTQGVAAGLVSLFLLRRLRSAVFARIRQRAVHQQQMPPPPSSSSSPSPPSATSHVHNSPFAGGGKSFNGGSSGPFPSVVPSPASPSVLYGIFGWALDGTAAFCVATMVSLVWTDQEKVLDKLSKLPLMPGHSRVAREFCPDIMETHRQLQNELGDDDDAARVLQHPSSPYLQAILSFHKHCRQRHVVESRIRADKGVSEDFLVEIPEPGVPESMLAEDDDHLNFAGSASDGSDQWADGMTTDREDDRRWR